MIEVRDLGHRYGPLTAVESLDFRVERGEFLGLLGPNGAGKSTTMRAIVGLLSPTQGEIRIGGHDIGRESMQARRLLGYLPENVSLYRELRVSEFLRFAGRAKRVDAGSLAGEIDRVVETCGLEPVRHRLIGFCSRGYRQRIGLAQALLGDPPALVLDEPTVGLDPAQVADIRDRIAEIARDKAVIFSTHILPEASRLCSKVLILNRGRCVAIDTPTALASAVSGRPRVRLRVSPAADARAHLNASALVEVCHDAGDTEFVLELAPDIDTAELVESLVRSGLRVHELRAEGAGLEDVFLQLVRSDPAETAAGEGASA